jgi:hypothetical protein
MEACRRQRVGFSLSVPRYQSMWKARRHTGPYSWRPALGMSGAEIAEVSYTPGGWRHEPLRLIIRRVRVPAAELSRNPRSRRRGSIAKGQLELALRGRREHVYAYSFVVTDRLGDAAELEFEHRQRAHIEERIKDAKLGCGLHHLPMRSERANRGWLIASVIATNLLSMISAVQAQENHRALLELAAHAQEEEDLVRPAAARVARHNTGLLRRWLIDIPARIVKGGRRLRLRLASGMAWKSTFWATYGRLRMLSPPSPA